MPTQAFRWPGPKNERKKRCVKLAFATVAGTPLSSANADIIVVHFSKVGHDNAFPLAGLGSASKKSSRLDLGADRKRRYSLT